MHQEEEEEQEIAEGEGGWETMMVSGVWSVSQRRVTMSPGFLLLQTKRSDGGEDYANASVVVRILWCWLVMKQVASFELIDVRMHESVMSDIAVTPELKLLKH